MRAAPRPITGALEPCRTEFTHEMRVQRIYESPRVTKPYTENQWSEIRALGHLVDNRLNAADVRLTMGGEPTFISVDDPEAPEWKRDALGPEKRKLADTLLKKMRDHFAPHGLLHYGQGKWYPGELLPRWALSCYWRKDGSRCGKTRRLIAEDSKDYGYTIEDAQKFLDALTRRLQVDVSLAMTAYEDSFLLSVERTAPAGKRRPARFENRKCTGTHAAWRAFLNTDLGKLIGFVLPLRRIATRAGQTSLDEPPVVSAIGAHIPGSGRFADRLPPAARFTSVDETRRRSLFV